MVNDASTDDLIRWSDDGDSFFVPSADKFGRELLPRFFKHSNFGSFVRQLNMYGFHKVPHLQQGVLKSDSEETSELLEFSNPNFARAQPDLLCLIKRQKAKTDLPVDPSSALDLPSLLTDLASVRKHQAALSSDLKSIQASNQALWQEAIQSRERHTRHQDTINKILRFLAGVFGGGVVGEDVGDSGGMGGRAEEVREESSDRGDGGKGKGREEDGVVSTGTVGSARKRPGSRFLLKDVEGRKPTAASATATDAGVVEEEDEEIEEIPARPAGLTRVGSNAGYPTLPQLSRAGSSSNPYSYVSPSLVAPPDSTSSSSSRFTTLPPTPSPTTTAVGTSADAGGGQKNAATAADSGPQYSLSPNYLASLLSGGGGSTSAQTLEAFLQLQNSQGKQQAGQLTPSGGGGGGGNVYGGMSDLSGMPSTSSAAVAGGGMNGPGGSMGLNATSAPPLFSSSGMNGMLGNPSTFNNNSNTLALLPSPGLSSMNQDFSQLYSNLPALPQSSPLSSSYQTQLTHNQSSIQSIEAEKAQLDSRTSDLEKAINQILENLPPEAKERLESAGGGVGQHVEGTQWGVDGTVGDEEMDRLLAQYVNTNGETTGETPTGSDWNPFPADSALGAHPSVDYVPPTPTGIFETFSSSESPMSKDFNDNDDEDDHDEMMEEEDGDDDLEEDEGEVVSSPVVVVKSEEEGKGTTPGSRGKKRKSDVVASPADESARRSGRRRKA